MKKTSQIHTYTSHYYYWELIHPLVILSDWEVFRFPNINKMSSIMRQKTIFNGRKLHDLKEMKKNNVSYESVGRRPMGG